ncbi:hypothetical protein BACCIP111899_02574 [Bacillus rhizoplanae]|uniref:DUF2268 domain-containing protein n=1 Tax=Bacillus rhizoplanae TaxID=2880966 RepID=A0ABN7ZZ88_9BACI|nr:hypothetical protein [Bacillus rhizoplanae]CAG9613359.1 hypothetical protein BACCIP111899_02574 [Bacillus rhizoplanae]
MKQKLYSYCLQGNVNKAYEYLQSIDNNIGLEKLKKKYYNRFFVEKPVFQYKTKDAWIRSVIRVYYEYFISVLTNRKNKKEAESILAEHLIKLLPGFETTNDIDSIEEILAKEFKSRGFYFLGGITPPYRGPYIWRKEEKAEYEIILPDKSKKVVVYFMSDFIMQSWLHFATFGGRATGGWASKNALYCVKERYEKVLNKPDFLYSYLAHEAQHLADYEDFPCLLPVDLEYRAKLVELIYHPLNNKVLMKKFLSDADNNRENPHPYSSYVICSNLSKEIHSVDYVTDPEKWREIDSKILSNVAKELFQKHTNLLTNQGKENVESVI